MRRSKLFTKTRKEAPSDETSKNAQLLIRAGFVHKEMAGVYSFLPLGLKVLNRISMIIREEMDSLGGQEMLMPALQPKERYETSGRWDDNVVDVWFKTKLASGTELGLGFSHEENLVPLAKNFVESYRDLPFAPYQIQMKFRNELRSKSGLMRGREFLMKDMYSFAISQEQHDEFYARAQTAYSRIYQRLGIGEQTFMTFASGGSFSKYSHEFQTLSGVGEDTIYLDRTKKIAINEEVLSDEIVQELGLEREALEKINAIEVGNIFSLNTKFSEPFNLVVPDQKGEMKTVIMGCYGIGVSRVMGAIAELMSDEKGLSWPSSIAPVQVYLVSVGADEAVTKAADELYELLLDHNIEVLYDDRDLRPGEKFSDADLMGIPARVVVSPKTIEQNKIEYKLRQQNEPELLTVEALLAKLV